MSLNIARNLLSISIAMVLVVLISRTAQANEQTPFDGAFTVQAELITAIAGCAPGDSSCSTCLTNSGFFIEAQGIGKTSLGTLFIEILKCFNPAGGSFGTYAGTFTMTAPNGKDSVTGTYSGQNNNAGDAYGFGPFSGVLTIAGGTGRFAGAKGTANFQATAGPITAGPNLNSGVLMAFYSVHGNLGLLDND